MNTSVLHRAASALSAALFGWGVIVFAAACGSNLPPVPPPSAVDAGTASGPDAGSEPDGSYESRDGGHDAGDGDSEGIADAGPATNWITVVGHRYTHRYDPDGGVLSREPMWGAPKAWIEDGGVEIPVRVDADGGEFWFTVPQGAVYWVSTYGGRVRTSATRLDLDHHLLGRNVKPVWTPGGASADITFYGGTPPSPTRPMPVFVPSVGGLGALYWASDGGVRYSPAGGWGHHFDGALGDVVYLSQMEPRSSPVPYLTRAYAGASSDAGFSDAGFHLEVTLQSQAPESLNTRIERAMFAAHAPLVHPQAQGGYAVQVAAVAAVTDGTRWVEPPKGLDLFRNVYSSDGLLDGLQFVDRLPKTWARLVIVKVGFGTPVNAPGVTIGHSAMSGVVVRTQSAQWIRPALTPPGPITVAPLPGSPPGRARLSWMRPVGAHSFAIGVTHYLGGSSTRGTSYPYTTDQTSIDLPIGALESGEWYVFDVVARTYGMEDGGTEFTPFSTPLEYGYATSSSDAFRAP